MLFAPPSIVVPPCCFLGCGCWEDGSVCTSGCACAAPGKTKRSGPKNAAACAKNGGAEGAATVRIGEGISTGERATSSHPFNMANDEAEGMES